MSRAAPAETVLPAWPALLTTELACAYTSLSEVSFRLFARKHSVEPVECAGLAVTRWRRSDLDRLVDSLPARGAEMSVTAPNANEPDPATAAHDAAQAALARAAKRARS